MIIILTAPILSISHKTASVNTSLQRPLTTIQFN